MERHATKTTIGSCLLGACLAGVPAGEALAQACTGCAVEEVDPVVMGWAADGYPVDELDTYRVYATFQCSVAVRAVGDAVGLFTTTASDGYFFNSMATVDDELTHLDTPATAEQVAENPALQWDTFVTITLESPGLVFAPEFVEQTTHLTGDFTLNNTGWFVPDYPPEVWGRRILIAQFTVNEGVQIAGTNWRISYEYEDDGWAQEDRLGDWNTNPSIPVCPFPTSLDCQPVPWHLDRIDQRSLPLDDAAYFFGAGSDVDIYVVATGMRTTHVDFGGRASAFYPTEPGQSGMDPNGYGTHIAGVAGGSTYGAAPEARLHDVRVLNAFGSGSNSDIILGLIAVENAAEPGRSVVVLPLGGGPSPAVDDQVRTLCQAGIAVVVAAGNEGDACDISPARVSAALTVGASTSNDAVASFSNQGSCVDVFAPGVDVTGPWKNSDLSTNTLSGTGSAAAVAAGAVAVRLGLNPSPGCVDVKADIVGNATAGVLNGVNPDTPNLLLFLP